MFRQIHHQASWRKAWFGNATIHTPSQASPKLTLTDPHEKCGHFHHQFQSILSNKLETSFIPPIYDLISRSNGPHGSFHFEHFPFWRFTDRGAYFLGFRFGFMA
jgi:hypothetical protein